MQYLAPIVNDQQVDVNGDPLSGGTIETYLAGTSTPARTTSDRAGLVENTWPIVLNVLGVNEQGSVWVVGGQEYKFVIKDENGVVQRIIDNVMGMNDSGTSFDQWIIFPGTPTYISGNSFSVGGDQTPIFQRLRRVRTTNAGGVIYATIESSSFSGANTTVTLANDAGVLDLGLSQVSYGIISAEDSSINPGAMRGTALTQAADDNSIRIATTAWVRLAMQNIATVAGFVMTLGTNASYIIFPNWLGGWIVQYGSVPVTLSGGGAVITFPIVFPAARRGLVISNGDWAGGASPESPIINNATLANFGVVFPGAGSGTRRCSWIAIGD